ncbi:hypothetical protein [Caldichromatium japonicum]|uniref:hypothetical protein n=1 Tax=Caldichromatium japonicum TaxID=2699430 RepID=UPI001B355FC4|nr:hypothetical protein [Caldichromatium japonicum]
MAKVIFYEKPGCSGNARQKALLEAAGHSVEARDLLAKCWTRMELVSFFAGRPVAEWFNRNAPAVKRGEIVPEECDEATALALLQRYPLPAARSRRHALRWLRSGGHRCLDRSGRGKARHGHGSLPTRQGRPPLPWPCS